MNMADIAVEHHIVTCNLTHFQPMFHFYTSWKHRKNWRFSDVFREYRSGTLVDNGLTVTFILTCSADFTVRFVKAPSIKDIRTNLAHFLLISPSPLIPRFPLLVDVPLPPVHADTLWRSNPREKYTETWALYTFY